MGHKILYRKLVQRESDKTGRSALYLLMGQLSSFIVFIRVNLKKDCFYNKNL